MLSEIHTPEYLLTQWGKWAYQNRGLSLYYPSMTTFERLRAKGGSGVDITDDQAHHIDAVVSTLKRDTPKVHAALALHYVAGMPYRHIGKELHCHHRTASDWVQQGIMYVKAALEFGAPNAPEALSMARR